MTDNYKYKELTDKIIKAFYKVYNKLGYGFLEKVYENAMAIELRKMGLKCIQQAPIRVYYEGEEVGFFRADLLVEDLVICELKAAEVFCTADEAQLTNYLRATPIEVGLLFNFGRKPEFRRRVFTNEFKVEYQGNHNPSSSS
ncbi:MAG: GxxExxY protein [Chitinophagaceae bacterium]|nr:MAG: GxxExxY protein [Chitinophagaceae bacterium]